MEDLRAVVAEAPMLGVLFLAMRLQSVRVHGMDSPGFARVAMEVRTGASGAGAAATSLALEPRGQISCSPSRAGIIF